MAKGEFLKDLRNGMKAQAMIRDIFIKAGFTVFEDTDITKEMHIMKAYDMAIRNHRHHLLEIKDESNYAGSQNLIIEYCSGQDSHPSGLYRTEASVQLHIFGDTCILFKTQPMRNFLHDKLHEGVYKVIKFRNGDSNVQGILVPKADISEFEWADVKSLEDIATSKLWR